MIVKCQKPLATNGEPKVLIYGKGYKHVSFSPYNEDWKKFFGDRAKVYAKAHIEGGELCIDRKVEDKEW